MTPVVRFSGVSRSYAGPPFVTALRPTDLTIDSGEYIAVIGPSGSGKSTFLNLVGLLDRPTEGTYELDGVDVGVLGEAGRSALRGHRIGFVFQSFHLLPHRSAVDNVALGQIYSGQKAALRRQAALQALERVSLSHRAYAFPTTLSGGEQQRVAIARALVNEPRLLLCDEPTGNLDSGTAGTVLDLLDEVHATEFTIIVITHDPNVAARAQRIISIRDGVVHD